MIKEKKEKVISDLQEIYKSYSVIIFTKYQGLKTHNLDELRVNLRDFGAIFRVTHNKLSVIAAKNVNFTFEESFFAGPSAIAYSDDVLGTVKTLFNFSKKNQKLNIVAAVINSKIYNYQELESMSKLPSIEIIRGKIIASLYAPGKKLLLGINSVSSKIIGLLNNFYQKNN